MKEVANWEKLSSQLRVTRGKKMFNVPTVPTFLQFCPIGKRLKMPFLRQNLSSGDTQFSQFFFRSHFEKTTGDSPESLTSADLRAFSFSASKLWKSLLLDIKKDQSSLCVFKGWLQTYLYDPALNYWTVFELIFNPTVNFF